MSEKFQLKPSKPTIETSSEAPTELAPIEKENNLFPPAQARIKLEQIKKNVMQYQGQQTMNPFTYIKNVIVPLEKRLEARDSKVLYEIRALPISPVPQVAGLKPYNPAVKSDLGNNPQVRIT